MMQPSVNRYLKDSAMDRIDHALGRPLDPVQETFRNRYVVDGKLADELAASPHWQEHAWSGSLRYFSVTDDGRNALTVHLREIGDPHRAFVVKFEGFDHTVVATSRSKAKYSSFLDISDAMPDLTFVDFCRRVSVRVTSSAATKPMQPGAAPARQLTIEDERP